MTSRPLLNKLGLCKPTPLSLKQILQFSKDHRSKESVTKTAKFLSREVPVRLMRRYLDLNSKQDIVKYMRIERLNESFLKCSEKIVDQKLESWHDVQNFTETLQEVERFIIQEHQDALQTMHQRFVVDNPDRKLKLSHDADAILDNIGLTMLGLRVLITQHDISFHNVNGDGNERGVDSVVTPDCNIGVLVNCAAEDTKALSIDKNGDAPNVVIGGDLDSEVVCVEAHLHFILREILKNSMGAMINNGTADDHAINIRIACKDEDLVIKVSDVGGGMSCEQRDYLFRYFYSTAPVFQPTYTYSKNFGSMFEGFGVGLPNSRIYAKYMGGDVRIETLPGYGTEAYIHINRTGNAVGYVE
ncbi:hypothetical protein AKO1_013652, partial [Acrasis kona]